MTERANDRLVRAADLLARSSPACWDELLIELSSYVRERASDCVKAPTDQTFIAQGRARQAQELFDLFMNCRTNAAKITERLKK